MEHLQTDSPIRASLHVFSYWQRNVLHVTNFNLSSLWKQPYRRGRYLPRLLLSVPVLVTVHFY